MTASGSFLFIHGIRTHAEWQKVFMERLQGDFRVHHFDYGRVGFAPLFLNSAQLRLVDQLYDALHPLVEKEAPVSVLAHSLGTVLFLKCLLKYPDISVDTVFLAGSVADEQFDWEPLLQPRPRVNLVVNFVASRDRSVRYGSFFLRRALHMGGAGVRGFQKGDLFVLNRQLPFFAHESVTNPRAIPELMAWAPGGTQRATYTHLIQAREELLNRSLLSLTVAALGSIAFIVPELVVERGIISWSGGSYKSLRDYRRERRGVRSAGNATATLILGDAGEGKTLFLLNEFLARFETFRTDPDGAIPIWLQVSRLAETGRTSLFEVVLDRIIANCPEYASRPFIVFLDGMDEWPSAALDAASLREITSLHMCAGVYLSSRTRFALSRYTQPFLKDMFSDVIELQKWTSHDARSFARSFIEKGEPEPSARVSIQREFEDIYQQLSSNGPALISPLVLTMVLVLLCMGTNSRVISANISEIYREIIALWIDRELGRVRQGAVDTVRVTAAWTDIAMRVFRSTRLSLHKGERALLTASEMDATEYHIVTSLLQYEPTTEGLRVFGFLHESFLEYFIARFTLEQLRAWSSDGQAQDLKKILAYPVDEIVAVFLKSMLEKMDADTRAHIATRLHLALSHVEYREQSGETEILFLNGLFYSAGRLDVREGASLLAEVWQAHRTGVAQYYPQAYITLLSGVSLNNLFDIEAEYVEQIVGTANSRESATMVGWHLIYYGDMPAVGIDRYVHSVSDPTLKAWIKSKTALLRRITSNTDRDVRLTLFHLCALWALATHHRYQFAQEELVAVDESLHVLATRYPEREKTAKKLRVALTGLISSPVD